MNDTSKCPIWKTDAHVCHTSTDGVTVFSPRAGGRYAILRQAETNLRNMDDRARPLLTTWIVDQHRLGTEQPVITLPVLGRIKNARALGIAQRRDRVLRWFERRSSTLGQSFTISTDKMAPEEHVLELLAWSECFDKPELCYLFDFCAEEGLLKKTGNDGIRLMLTPRGYDHLDKLDRVNVDSEQAFVAMWFDESMDTAYNNGIDPAIRNAGYRPLRIDRKQHINRVDDEIIDEIRRSRFVVADFTSSPDQPRGGVYFEAGFAYGLGVPVIWTCQKNVIGNVHFDTRQFNHILWATSDELCKHLKNRIEAVIGEGPLKGHVPKTR